MQFLVFLFVFLTNINNRKIQKNNNSKELQVHLGNPRNPIVNDSPSSGTCVIILSSVNSKLIIMKLDINHQNIMIIIIDIIIMKLSV